MKKWLLLAPAALLIYLFATHLYSGEHRLALGEDRFCIPGHMNVLDQTTSPALVIERADQAPQGGSFQVAMGPDFVRSEFPAYKAGQGGSRGGLTVNVREINAQLSHTRFRPEARANVLQLTGAYEDAKVVPQDDAGFYRVSNYPGPNFPIWHVLTQQPESDAAIPDTLDEYYLAMCMRTGGVNGTGSRCDYDVRINNFLVNITTSENNLVNREAITGYVSDTLRDWQENCD